MYEAFNLAGGMYVKLLFVPGCDSILSLLLVPWIKCTAFDSFHLISFIEVDNFDLVF